MAFDVNSIGEIVWGIAKWFILGAIVLIVLGAVIWGLVWYFQRKKYFLKVSVKLPRSGGSIFGEMAKGHYDVKAGIVDIKRKGVKPVAMKPFDLRRFLQGDNFLEVLMLSPTDFIPIDPNSYTIVTEKYINNSGEEVKTKHSVFEIVTDNLKRKTWKNYTERATKARFTLVGFLDQHWRAIELGILVFIIFIGFMVLWMRMPSICTA
ncbi:MAG TPA: hypothetical protein ENH99_00140 [Candidatus Pacearchaeota archaeon]|nr:hypothetical protein [Candidatus Pacearchaeota archaeon]